MTRTDISPILGEFLIWSDRFDVRFDFRDRQARAPYLDQFFDAALDHIAFLNQQLDWHQGEVHRLKSRRIRK